MQLLPALLCIALNACSLASAPDQSIHTNNGDSETVVFSVRENGGCMMMGANCARYELHADGNFNLYRVDSTNSEQSGRVSTDIMLAWLSLAESLDFPALKERLDAGICRACVDGIDLQYVITLKAGRDAVTLNSAEYGFSHEEPFFAASDRLYRAMAETAQLRPISSR